MFVVEAIHQFSKQILSFNEQKEEIIQKDIDITKRKKSIQHEKELKQYSSSIDNENNIIHDKKKQQQKYIEKQKNEQQEEKKLKDKQKSIEKQDQLEGQKSKQKEQQLIEEINYLSFQQGQKLLVRQAYQNGWWYGNTLKNPEKVGFFPSNFVQTGIKPPLPMQIKDTKEEFNEDLVFKGDEMGNWMNQKIQKEYQKSLENQQSVGSEQYQCIKGYRNIKISDKNQNLLKGNYVKFDVNTGLASVPIKDQAPAAKAVRQMGYYFDYNQWNQQRNKNLHHKARPDRSRKKTKKLNLKMMD